MSEVKVNKISPRTNCGTVTLGDSGDTFTIPAGVTLTNSGTATGFGPTGAVSWDTTKKTTGFTAVNGVGYFCDTSSAAFTVTLPSSPSAGAVVGIADYANTFATNNLTVGRNSQPIDGQTFDLILNTNGIAITLVYVDATQGWKSINSNEVINSPLYVAATGGTITTCGDFKTHVFTGPGTFTVTCAGNSAGSNSVEYLVVAGGGQGGSAGYGGAGGGAGGYRQNYPSPVSAGLPVTATTYPITVGGGGTGAVVNSRGGSGSPSIFSTITSTGGGGGGGSPSSAPEQSSGSPGGSGGGSTGTAFSAGTGNTPPVSPPQGNTGGQGFGTGTNGGGGGGGAGGVGAASPSNTSAGAGGIGSPIATTFFGPTSPSYGTPGPAPGRYFAGGGGGQAETPGGPGPGAGGAGGGGAGAAPANSSGTAGTTNTGGGGGGEGNQSTRGVNGGSGIVVIRYKFQ